MVSRQKCILNSNINKLGTYGEILYLQRRYINYLLEKKKVYVTSCKSDADSIIKKKILNQIDIIKQKLVDLKEFKIIKKSKKIAINIKKIQRDLSKKIGYNISMLQLAVSNKKSKLTEIKDNGSYKVVISYSEQSLATILLKVENAAKPAPK